MELSVASSAPRLLACSVRCFAVRCFVLCRSSAFVALLCALLLLSGRQRAEAVRITGGAAAAAAAAAA